MRFRFNKKKASKDGTTVINSSLPPPAPSLLKPDSLKGSPRREQDVAKRSVQFRDNRFPDGRLTSPVIPRPRLTTFDQPERIQTQGSWSHAPSILSSTSQTVFPSLSSYPVSYAPIKHSDFPADLRNILWGQNTYNHSDTYGFKSNSLREFGRVSSDFNIAKSSRNAYTLDVPKPDYPMFIEGMQNLNRDSGLDTDSRSSSGMKANVSDQYYNINRNGNFGLKFTDERESLPAINSNTGRQTYTNYVKFPSETNCRYMATSKTVFNRDEHPFLYNSKMAKTASLTNVSGRFSKDYSIPFGMICNNNKRQEGYHSLAIRSPLRIYDQILQKPHCSACSCCNDFCDEIGRYNSVATNTDISPAEKTRSNSLSRVQLNESHKPLPKRQLPSASSRDFEWKSISGTEDFVYRPRSQSSTNAIETKQEYTPLNQVANVGKRLPRCQPKRGSPISSGDDNIYEERIKKSDFNLRRLSLDSTSDYRDEDTPPSSVEIKRSISPIIQNNYRSNTNSSFVKL